MASKGVKYAVRGIRGLSPEEKKYLTNDTASPNVSYWMMRTAIFHYSNGTNRCSVEGCTVPVVIDGVIVLTLEHDNFDRAELNQKLGISSKSGGTVLARKLVYLGFPDVGISVKCMMHNAYNRSPKHGAPRTELNDEVYQIRSINGTKSRARVRTQAFAIYGYNGPIAGMTWEHSNNDGYVHRKYLQEKYNYSKPPVGVPFDALMIREHLAGIPNWPGLIVIDANANHIGMKVHRRRQRDISSN